jgi:hypothetical protein
MVDRRAFLMTVAATLIPKVIRVAAPSPLFIPSAAQCIFINKRTMTAHIRLSKEMLEQGCSEGAFLQAYIAELRSTRRDVELWGQKAVT